MEKQHKQQTKILGVKEARRRFLGICREMADGEGTPVVVTLRGKPVAHILPAEESQNGQ